MSETRPLVVAANWKMHKTTGEVDPYFSEFARSAPDPAAAVEAGVEIAFFPAFPVLERVALALGDRAGASAGAQVCHWEDEGAFTGEVSAPMIVATGATRVLVGHSERRRLFGETDETCRKRIRAALDHGLAPMVCVGETLEEREAGRARPVVVRQLTRAIEGLEREEYRRISIAYEPVWAIGTGRTAAPGDAQEMHRGAREVLTTLAGPEAAETIPILYGGSVKPENARELLGRADIDGALVGGASLDPGSFGAIARIGVEIGR